MTYLRCVSIVSCGKRYLSGAVLVLMTLSAFGARAGVPKLSESEKRKIDAWSPVVRVDKSSKYWLPTAMLKMASPVPNVMSVVMDISNYKDFMPMVIESKVVRRKGRRHIWAVIVTSLPWPLSNAWVAVKYTWSRLPGNGYRLKWVRHRGSMSRYWGQLDLYPWGRYHSLVVCKMQAVPDNYISRGQLNFGMVWGAEALLNRIRNRLDGLRRSGKLGFWKF